MKGLFFLIESLIDVLTFCNVRIYIVEQMFDCCFYVVDVIFVGTKLLIESGAPIIGAMWLFEL